MTLTYKDAGVNIDAQDEFVSAIKTIVKSTSRPEVLGGIGGFAGRFRLDTGNYKDPILVSSTDGVGTKLKVAFMADKHDTIGIDLVAMVVNDLIVDGAQPLFFLDYMACGQLNVERAKVILEGVAAGCREAGCALIGGETAEMPGIYSTDEYDLAGFGVGVVEADKIIDGSRTAQGDVVIGISSSGLHSNGFSLARKVLFDAAGYKIDSYVPELGRTVAEELLTPTRIYVKTVLNLMRDFELKALVHITGGGFWDNIPRVLSPRSRVVIKPGSWEIPPVFNLIGSAGNVAQEEMFRTFNMGIGMIMVVGEKDADDVMLRLKGLKENAQIIGYIDSRAAVEDPAVVFAE